MARVDVERTRRYAERGEREAAEQEHRRWLESLTPEHRAKHERPLSGLGLCGECMSATMAEAVATMDRAVATMRAAQARRSA